LCPNDEEKTEYCLFNCDSQLPPGVPEDIDLPKLKPNSSKEGGGRDIFSFSYFPIVCKLFPFTKL
jgi:hypothetical protein